VTRSPNGSTGRSTAGMKAAGSRGSTWRVELRPRGSLAGRDKEILPGAVEPYLSVEIAKRKKEGFGYRTVAAGRFEGGAI